MIVGFINNNKYNLDTFLINPNASFSYTTDTLIKYKELFQNMCDLEISLYREMKASIVDKRIEFTISLINNRNYEIVLASKWCVITEDDTGLFFIARIQSVTRVDVYNYKIVAEIDNVRSLPYFNRVYKMMDKYNGIDYLADFSVDLDRNAYNETYLPINTNYNDYLICAVIAGEPFYNLSTVNFNSDLLTSLSKNQMTNDIKLFVFTNSVNSNVFSHTVSIDGNKKSLLITVGDEKGTEMINNTTFLDSMTSFYDYLQKITDINSPKENVLAAYLIPKSMITFNSKVTIYKRTEISNNIYSGEINVISDCLFSGDNKTISDQIVNTLNVNALQASLKDIIVRFDNSVFDVVQTVKNKFHYFYSIEEKIGSLPPKDLIKCVISTNDSNIEINLSDFESYGFNTTHIVPYFNGDTLGYYVGFSKNGNLQSSDVNYRCYGSFSNIPILTNGVTRYEKTTGEVNKINTITSLGATAIGVAGSIATQNYPMAIAMGTLGAVKSITDYEYNRQKGLAIPTSIENLPTSVTSIIHGLFKISMFICNNIVAYIIEDDIYYYGMPSKTYFYYDFSISQNSNNVKYHKGEGIFSSADLADIFKTGVFIIELSNENTIAQSLDIIKNVISKGVSYDV